MILDKNFRLSPEAQKEVEAFKELYSIKTDREALEKLVKEAWHTRRYLQYFLTHRDATKEEPECLRRILYLGKFFCCKRAPRIVELPTLDICRACKMKVITWAKPPLVSTPASLESSDKRKPIKEVYCNSSGGIYVVKSVCDRCNEPCEKKALFYPEGVPAR
jgi:hypothetical protein